LQCRVGLGFSRAAQRDDVLGPVRNVTDMFLLYQKYIRYGDFSYQR